MSTFRAVYLTREFDNGVGVLLLTSKEQQNMPEKELIFAALMKLSKAGIELGPEDSIVVGEWIEQSCPVTQSKTERM